MEEIKVGEYIRTKEGAIDIVTYVPDYQMDNDDGINIENGLYIHLEDVKKHSKNIIDLIEVGDYVNGTLVTSVIIETNYIPQEKSKRRIFVNRDTKTIQHPIEVTKIKSICTKEQFAAVEYKLDN